MIDIWKREGRWLSIISLVGVLLLPLITAHAGSLNTVDKAGAAGPVSVVFFAAADSSSDVTFEWSTATETANAGFNLYAARANGLEQLNEALILSQAVDSTKRLDYRYMAAGGGDEYYLEEVDVDGGTRLQGPFTVGETYGTRDEAPVPDWESAGAENEAERMPAQSGAQTVDSAGALGKGELSGQLSYPEFAFGVSEDGIYRVTYEGLQKATGVGLLGVPARNLALTNGGEPVPMRIIGGRIMGPGVTLEFLGKGLDTLYTRENIYILSVNRDAYRKMPSLVKPVPDGAAIPSYYMETAAFEADNVYSIRSVSDDPWFDTLLHTDQPQSWNFSLETEDLAGSAGATLNLELWGASSGSHHLIARVNGTQTADINFDGRIVESASVPVSLKEGENALELTLPNDLGALTDTVVLEAYGVTYRRAFAVRNGRLSFAGDAQAFAVNGLSGSEVVVYHDSEVNGPRRVVLVTLKKVGSGYSATFAGGGAGTYYVSNAEAMLKPRIVLAAPLLDISAGTADFLIISHAKFIDGLAPLVAAREAQGYDVKVVDVDTVYRAYSGGVFDAEAIRAYIHHAIKNMGVAYVLLVGGDTHDYLGASDSLNKSFVPTLYAATSEAALYTPVDPLFTDVDGDNVPNAAIGRFPVRLASELQMMVDKTLAYDQKNADKTAVFAADNGFGYQGADMASALTGSWSIDEAFLDDSSVSAARKTLIDSLNGGVALASYVGHSSLFGWTGDGLFNVDDAKALNNYGKPTAVVQFGCYNTYYVDPNVNSLAHRLLLSGTNGAAVVSGATVLPGAYAEYQLGLRIMPLLSMPDKTIGAALQEAKEDLEQTTPGLLDVQLAYIILGDPTVAVVQSN